MVQRTFSIIKPDAVRKGAAGAILAALDNAGFNFVAMKKATISMSQAEGFYSVHAGKPFFPPLCEFMASGPLYLLVLEKEDAVAELRKLMGATDSSKAEEGTLRKIFGNPAVIRENAIHGSDSEESAAAEIGYWFAGYELL
jgi:nucleoside-diphosphate kinase